MLTLIYTLSLLVLHNDTHHHPSTLNILHYCSLTLTIVHHLLLLLNLSFIHFVCIIKSLSTQIFQQVTNTHPSLMNTHHTYHLHFIGVIWTH